MTRRRFSAAAVLLPAALLMAPLQAQSSPSEVAAERAAYIEWLERAPNSPLRAVAQQPIGEGVRLGPADAEVPLDGVPEHRVAERGGVLRLESESGGDRALARGVPFRLGRYTLVAGGPRGRSVLTVFAEGGDRKLPSHYPYDPALTFEGTLAPPERGGRVRLLAVDGVETEATEAGTVTVPVGGNRVKLRVRRIPTGNEESELEVFFRDATNGSGTYPAGRFVSLVPLGDGRYRLDFNRARNPFCAYSTAYPCPLPWSGNVIGSAVRAGERYEGGGLEVPPAGTEAR